MTLIALFTATLAYAVARYHLFSSSPWDWFALWTTNKALSWTAVLLFTLAYLIRDKRRARTLGLAGFLLALYHSAVSFHLLSPTYYAKLYTPSALTPPALASMLLGAAALAFFCFPAWTSRTGARERLGHARWLTFQRLGYLGLLLTALHCLLIGWPGWFKPSSWPGAMPPITLLGFLSCLPPLLARLRRSARLPASPPQSQASNHHDAH